jgi:hypothetical protein
MKKLLPAICLSAVLFLTSCADIHKDKRLEGNGLQVELAKQYIKLADERNAKYEWIEGDVYARKAKESLDGKRVFPEDPIERDMKGPYLDHVKIARNKLIKHMYLLNINYCPKAVAHTVYHYENWFSSILNNRPEAEIKARHDDYTKAYLMMHKKRMKGTNYRSFEMVILELDDKLQFTKNDKKELADLKHESRGLGYKMIIRTMLPDNNAVDGRKIGNHEMRTKEMKDSRNKLEAVRVQLVKMGFNPQAMTLQVDDPVADSYYMGDKVSIDMHMFDGKAKKAKKMKDKKRGHSDHEDEKHQDRDHK